jgi:alpha-D-ribose 1-methylphosphonate 5-triphosphate diphosphatase
MFHDTVMKVVQSLHNNWSNAMDMKRTTTTERVLRHGKVLVEGEGLIQADLMIDGGSIVEIGSDIRYAGIEEIDAKGCLVLPGIIDIHGDAFERNIMPRPKTMFPLDLAMLETDRQLAANGITTAYHGVTFSWEPGLRCLAQSLKVVAALDAIENQTLVDNRLHIRWENYAIDEVPDVVSLFRRTKRPLLAFNDHTTSGISGTRNPSKYRTSAEKAMISVEEYLALLQDMAGRSSKVRFATETVAAQAREHKVPMLSHDDMTADMRGGYRALGVHISEFPMNWETVEAASAAGDTIVLGAPNVVRGGSHNGAISAEEAIQRGQCHILASDYYYPALRHAALKLAREGVVSIEAAWKLVSAAPAQALGLNDRGTLTTGKRADIVIVDETSLQVVQTMSNGRSVYNTR